MTNLPENENNVQADEFSTVFSAPTEHKKATTHNKGKRLKIVISAVLAVVVLLGGTFAVVKLVPEKDDEPTVVDQEIQLLKYTSEEIKGITVKNKNGNFKIYSETVKESNEGQATDVTYWYLKNYENDLTDSDLISQIVNSSIQVSAIREITSKTAKECGLESPKITVDIVTTKGEEISLAIGDKSPDNAGVYLKTSSKEGVYLVGDSIETALSFSDLDLASMQPQGAIALGDKYSDYYEEGSLAKFDKITLSGENYPQDLVFVNNDNKLFSESILYRVSKPMQRDAKNVELLLNIFSQGFSVNGAYSYDVSKKAIRSLGLDKPDFVLSAEFDGFTYSYKFKKQNDGDFAYIGNDSKNIKRVSSESCSFLTSTTTDFYSSTLLLVSIDNVKNLSFETDGKIYSFNVTANPNEDDSNMYIVESGGKTYESSNFQTFYQYLCMLEAMDFSVEKTTQKPELTITYNYNDKKNSSTKIEFVKTSATKYQYSIDGVAMGKISSSSVKKIIKNMQSVLEGKTITVN